MEYNLKKIVDQIYIINLDKDINRMKILDKKMKKLNLNYKRIAGIDGKKVYKKYNKNNLTTGELGCLLSHIYILEDAINNNYENILIFEDDVIFHKNFLNKFYKNYKYLIQNEKKFDIIYLGASQKHNWNNVIIKKKYMIANRLDGTFAMIINKNIFNKILYQAKTLKYPIDSVLYYFIQNHSRAYCFLPYLVTVDINNISNTTPNFKLKNYYYKENKINIENFDYKIKKNNLKYIFLYIFIKIIIIRKYLNNIL